MSAINIIHSCNNTLIVSRNSQKIGTQSLLYDVAMIMQRYCTVVNNWEYCTLNFGLVLNGNLRYYAYIIFRRLYKLRLSHGLFHIRSYYISQYRSVCSSADIRTKGGWWIWCEKGHVMIFFLSYSYSFRNLTDSNVIPIAERNMIYSGTVCDIFF
jgi:hypothetical protein